MPMHPRPMAETIKPCRPSTRVGIKESDISSSSSILREKVCLPRTQKTIIQSNQLSKALRVDNEGVSVVDRLVGQGPEIDVRWAGGCPGALGHQDDDHVLSGVGIPGGAQATVPAVPARYRRDVITPGDHGDAEAPAMAV